jgi:hypothetical protein
MLCADKTPVGAYVTGWLHKLEKIELTDGDIQLKMGAKYLIGELIV